VALVVAGMFALVGLVGMVWVPYLLVDAYEHDFEAAVIVNR
jgi:hypothetical protein